MHEDLKLEVKRLKNENDLFLEKVEVIYNQVKELLKEFPNDQN